MDASYNIPENAKVYLDKPYAKIFWDPVNKILSSFWNGFSTYEEIVEIGKRILEATVLENAVKVLYDARCIEILDEESQNHISEEFTLEMKNAGVKYAATVIPEDVLAKFSVDNIQKKQDENREVSVLYFDSVTKAIDWLKKM